MAAEGHCGDYSGPKGRPICKVGGRATGDASEVEPTARGGGLAVERQYKRRTGDEKKDEGHKPPAIPAKFPERTDRNGGYENGIGKENIGFYKCRRCRQKEVRKQGQGRGIGLHIVTGVEDERPGTKLQFLCFIDGFRHSTPDAEFIPVDGIIVCGVHNEEQ